MRGLEAEVRGHKEKRTAQRISNDTLKPNRPVVGDALDSVILLSPIRNSLFPVTKVSLQADKMSMGHSSSLNLSLFKFNVGSAVYLTEYFSH